MTTTNNTIINYRNDSTGELAPPHVIGADTEGRKLYKSVEGWTPVDRDGNAVSVECDEDGNWTVGETQPDPSSDVEMIRHGSFGPIVWRNGETRAATQRDMDMLPVGPDLTDDEVAEIEE